MDGGPKPAIKLVRGEGVRSGLAGYRLQGLDAANSLSHCMLGGAAVKVSE